MCLPILRPGEPLLLEVSLRFSDLPLLHGGKPLGHELQSGSLDLP